MYSRSYKHYVTVLLLVVYIFNQMDRAIFGFLMEPIKHELALSDSQLGFLAGPALVLFYATLGIPIARWADRSNRVNIISTAVALWSAIVMCSAAVGKFWQFALARVGVGIGEAGFSAIAQSLIADYHSGADRTRALSIFMLAIPLGGVVSALTGGWINEAYGWRAAFIAAGLPGIVLALLVKWTVREPPRVSTSTAVPGATQQPPLRQVFATLWKRRALKHLAIAMGLVNTVCAAVLTWIPAFFVRNHAMSTGELGTWLALVGGLGGSAGIGLGGYLTSRYGSQDERMKVRLVAIATALIAPALTWALWCPSKQLALLILLPGEALMFFFYGPAFSLVQGLSAATMRATMASVFILIQVLAGGVVGVQLLGGLSDAFTPVLGSNATALRWSMTLICLLALWAAVHFWLAGRSIREDLTERD
jgi:MFS family permease